MPIHSTVETAAPAGLPHVQDCALLSLPKIFDPRGNLTFFEGERHIPFAIARAYWIYDVPGGAARGGHAYRKLEEFVVALSGSFDFHLDDGCSKRVVTLNRPYFGLHVRHGIWRHMENFSTNAVCLIVASAPYSEADYIRSYEDFLSLRGRNDDR